MTTIPQPAALADSFTAVYDAWNRLVRVTNDADNDKVVAEYAYDARNFRIVKKVYDDGSLDQTRYAFFSESWQVLEERVDGVASTDVEVQYVWGGPGRYVDELICRDRDTTANGIPNERVYALQDANFNVVALIADDGAVLERYRFTPYGQRTVLNANFTLHADPTEGGYAFVIGHQGLTHDLETGFIDNRHRFIVPPLGRFGQRDPLNQNVAGGGYQDGMGLYEYVGSNAVKSRDSSGMCISGTTRITGGRVKCCGGNYYTKVEVEWEECRCGEWGHPLRDEGVVKGSCGEDVNTVIGRVPASVKTLTDSCCKFFGEVTKGNPGVHAACIDCCTSTDFSDLPKNMYPPALTANACIQACNSSFWAP